MIIIQILFSLSAFVAIAAGVPQMLRLISVKNSDEFSLSTWGLWVCTQLTSVIYTSHLGDALLVTVNSAWLVFYVVMVGLILYYHPRRQLRLVADQESEQ